MPFSQERADYADEPSGMDELADGHCRGATAFFVAVLLGCWLLGILAARGLLR